VQLGRKLSTIAASMLHGRQQFFQAQCPEGHDLLPWSAPAGMCHGCGKVFPDGEQVMDCRRCEWMLCEVCCPRTGSAISIWGRLSQLPYYASESINATFNAWDEAIDDFMERHGPTFEAADKVMDAVADKVDYLADMLIPEESDSDGAEEHREVSSIEDREEAREIVIEFCETFPPEQAMPSDEDLDQFWSRVSLLYARSMNPRPIAEAMRRQLATLQQVVRPAEIRALAALDDLCRRGAVGREIITEVTKHAKPRLQELAWENKEITEGENDAEGSEIKFARRLLSSD